MTDRETGSGMNAGLRKKKKEAPHSLVTLKEVFFSASLTRNTQAVPNTPFADFVFIVQGPEARTLFPSQPNVLVLHRDNIGMDIVRRPFFSCIRFETSSCISYFLLQSLSFLFFSLS
jgi:hypothetical protein